MNLPKVVNLEIQMHLEAGVIGMTSSITIDEQL